MKILIMRHAKVNMKWERKYNSSAYDLACLKYDTSGIIPITDRISDENINVIYVSELSRSAETAKQLFKKAELYRTALLNEVPIKSFADTKKEYPLWVWNILGRMQWIFYNKRQPETKKQTAERAEKAIRMVEEKGQDCWIITHGFFMRTLIRELRLQGYKMEKQIRPGIANLDKITAMK